MKASAVALAGAGLALAMSGVLTRAAPRGGPDGFEPGSTVTRAAVFTPGTYDPVGRTIDAVFSSGARIRRWGQFEELAVSADAIDLARAATGRMSFLFNHDQDRPIGVVEDARIEDGKLVGRLRFAETDDGRAFEGQIARGELSSLSVGYRVTTWTLTAVDDNTEIWRADKWELLEVSLVTVPADPQAAVRSASSIPSDPPRAQAQTEESDVLRRNSPQAGPSPADTPTPAATTVAAPAIDGPALVRAERERTATLLDIGQRAGLDAAAVNAAISDGTSVEAFRIRGFDHMTARSDAVRTTQGTLVQVTGPSEDQKRGEAIENALLHRFDPRGVELTDHGRQFRGMTLLEMGADCLESRGIRTRGMSKHERAQHMLSMRSEGMEIAIRSGGSLSTSDFPNVLSNVANKTLRMGYAAAPQTFRPLVRVVTVADFKPVSRVQLGEAPRLEKTNESGEFKRGKMGDSAEKYAVSTYGKIVGITRQVIINDDLDAFTRIPRAFGVAAANLESDLVWGEIINNRPMGDGVNLFDAAHNNVGTGQAISSAGVGSGREAMRNQTGLDGKTLLNVTPTYLVVPVALETVAEQFLGQIYPTKSGDVVTASMKKLVPISEPRLDVASKTTWYLAGSPNEIDIVELAYLEGMEGLYTETRMGFDVDGVEVKVRQDVAAKAIDHRGLYRSA